MRKRLLLIGGGLAALVAIGAIIVYIGYQSGWFRSTKTERGETSTTNEATAQSAPRRRVNPAWPFFRYDAFRTGFNPDAVARPPFSVVWKRGLFRDGYLEAPAVVADGVIVYASYGKSFGSDLFAADAVHGRLLWRKHFRHPANFAGSPGIAGGRVYITSHDGNLRVYALRTGRYLWRMKIAAAESPPIVAGGLVYFGDGPKGGGDGTFRAVDIRTHRVRWSHRASGNISSGAALTRTSAYFASYGGSVYAVNRLTGRLRWRTAVQGPTGGSVPFYSTPALGGGKVIVGGNDGSVYALDARTGAERWRYDAGGYVYSSAAIWHGRVLIGDFGGGFHALSLNSGRELWTRQLGPILGSATVIQGIVYVSALRPPRTYAFDARTGRQVWRFDDGQFTPIIADGTWVWLVGKAAVYRLVERGAAHRAAAQRRAAKRQAAARRRTGG